jgi:carbon monoxide dehydrogenase subunit G
MGRRGVGAALAATALGWALAGCGGSSEIDWAAPESLILWEKAMTTEDGVEFQYWSLIDAPPDAVYSALTDVEHYAEFVPGVSDVQLLDATPTTKTAQIAQQIVSRQGTAKVQWTFTPARRRIEFRTLESDLAHDDGSHEVEGSPDGRRSLVRTTFLVSRTEPPQAVAVGVLAAATRESFRAAADGVKRRATNGASPPPPPEAPSMPAPGDG